MPVANVTHDNGATPVIPGNAARKFLILQNNDATRGIRYRLGSQVSLTDPAKRGLLLRPNGGTITLTGQDAVRSIYAVHGRGVGQIVEMDYDTDI